MASVNRICKQKMSQLRVILEHLLRWTGYARNFRNLAQDSTGGARGCEGARQ
jgi:hypothetical protein